MPTTTLDGKRDKHLAFWSTVCQDFFVDFSSMCTLPLYRNVSVCSFLLGLRAIFNQLGSHLVSSLIAFRAYIEVVLT